MFPSLTIDTVLGTGGDAGSALEATALGLLSIEIVPLPVAAAGPVAAFAGDQHVVAGLDTGTGAAAGSSQATPSAIEAWNSAVRKEMQAKGCSQAAATRAVAVSQKQLHEDYLLEFNARATAGRRR